MGGLILLPDSGPIRQCSRRVHRPAPLASARAVECQFVRQALSQGGPDKPFEALITGRRGIHALREKDGLDSELQLPQTVRKVRPLYNPMWHLLADRATGAKGTYHFRGDTDLVWHCIDQIIVSADLRRLLGDPEILTSLKDAGATDRSLVTAAGLPDEKRYSDHLPVQMTIDLDRVSP
jgi:hypothetical protein